LIVQHMDVLALFVLKMRDILSSLKNR
jgi:hypothetical protein